ncbi:MAG: tellurite resistance TerB family protein [Rhodobiaceae bacterium]|nr:tellurite resistance TerB family protein [Rhodobiaceae bacterium]MCC0014215.1 tellurite resistance TerB family protein [Rhodobiaceae bacterium]MCC0017771.1 tellurite resistance TerB family protein [Rhodobiaceae bacterium]MCC0061938.1 tellurite resistance TerB family protein [Rhodobiaceae bacterium]
MSGKLSAQEALIYVMVTISAAEGTISDDEIAEIGMLVRTLPVFGSFDTAKLVDTAEACGEILANDANGLETVLDMVAESLPHKLYDTAYALAVEVAAADLEVAQEELRFLQLLRDKLVIDKLVVAAIERGARARLRTL